MISEEKLQSLLNFRPFEGQLSVLRTYNGLDARNRELAMSCGRRWGKSSLAAFLALKTLLEPNKRIWIVAPTYDLTNKVFDYVVRWFLKLFPESGASVSYRPMPRIRTPDGSWLEGRSAENPNGLLGEEVDLLIIDEAAIIQRSVFNRYLYPVTSSRLGRRILISTPFGKNWFYEHWLIAKEYEAAFNFSSDSNPFFPAGEFETARKTLPEDVFRQEYQAVFSEDAASVFRRISESVSDVPTYEEADHSHSYVMGVDLAKINDFTVLTVLDMFTHKVVAWERFNQIDYSLQKARIIALAKRYQARIFIDSTGVGNPISEDLKNSGVLVEDYKLSSKSKRELVEKLSIFLEQKGLVLPNEPVLLDELSVYGYELSEAGNVRYSAPQGKHDDCVISLALAVWGLASPDRDDKRFLRKPSKKIIKFEYL